MSTINNFKKLTVWQEGKELAVLTYKLTSNLPQGESYGLASQMQRSAVSISSNIAEGYRRNSKLDFKRFLNIALGSAAELETQLIISKEVYPELQVEKLIIDVDILQRKLIAFIKTLA